MDVTLTRATCLPTVVDHVHPIMEKVLLDGCGLFQQDIVPCQEQQ